jgi:hypothetical protein
MTSLIEPCNLQRELKRFSELGRVCCCNEFFITDVKDVFVFIFTNRFKRGRTNPLEFELL